MTTPPRRVSFRRFGDASVLEITAAPERAPGPDEITIDVAFAGVNYADVLARRGFYKWAPPFPTCVGFEVSGTVRERGERVKNLSVGDRVMAVTRFGGYADRLTIEAERAYRVPSRMTLEEAAAIPAVYLTAWHALEEIARIRAGEHVLIQAVAGGVGIAALQIAKHRGAITYGTASQDEKLELASAMGLDHPINYARDDFEDRIGLLTRGRGVDVVLDSLGGEGLRKGYRSLARGGRLVTIGAAQVAPSARDVLGFAKAAVELVQGGVYHPFSLIEDNRSIAGVQILLWWDDVAHLARGMAAILELHGAGVVKPVIDSVFPLESAGLAQDRLASRASKGKILLRAVG